MKIEIISIGLLDSNIQVYLVHLISERFNAEVKVGSNIPIDIFTKDTLRGQYLSTEILEVLSDKKGLDDDVFLGVVDVDLYVPSLNFVFGEADPIKKVAVISITRLKPGFYGLRDDTDLIFKRAGKEAVHELGHIFKLRHCIYPKCVMFFSNCLEDTDLKEDRFCSRCRKYLDVSL